MADHGKKKRVHNQSSKPWQKTQIMDQYFSSIVLLKSSLITPILAFA